MRIPCVALLLTLPLTAQQFRPERHAAIPLVINNWAVSDIAVGDVDGDGLDDMFFALDYGGIAHLRADGNGGFIDVTTGVLQPPYAAAYGVSLGDADNDGDLDLVAVHDHTGDIQVCMNLGNGTFVDMSGLFSPTRASWPTAVRWIDADGDGLLDVFVVDSSGNRLFLQQSGVLVDVSATHLAPGLPGASARLRVIDLDADGDQDVVGYRSYGLPLILINDGTGRFAAAPSASFPTPSFTVLGCGDFDGDGLADLVVQVVRATRLWLQTAGGTFADRTPTHFAGLTTTEALLDVDVDNDGDLDLCQGGALFVNDGSGRFTDETAARWTQLTPRSSFTITAHAHGDFDGDGDQDYATVDSGSLQVVSVNHHLQVSAPSAPVRGGTYEIVYESGPGYAGSAQTVLPWFALTPYSLVLPPFGRLGVDPATTVAGPALPLSAPAGRTALQLTVPANPALSGVSLYLQAVVVRGPTTYTLTNTVHDRIL